MDIFHSYIFSNTSPQTRETKENIMKCDYIKLKSFFIAKETFNKMKRQPTEWENIFVNDTSDNWVISKIYKKRIQINTKKIPIKMRAKDLNKHFSKEDIHMANRHMKGCSTSLIIREIKIKTTVRYHLTPIRMSTINISRNNEC